MNRVVIELEFEYPASEGFPSMIAQKAREAARNALGDHPVQVVRAEFVKEKVKH